MKKIKRLFNKILSLSGLLIILVSFGMLIQTIGSDQRFVNGMWVNQIKFDFSSIAIVFVCGVIISCIAKLIRK